MSKRIWLLVAALAACTDAHGPREGTQTGNPPVLDRGKVKLEVGADEVHVTGEPGAAAPGGATIEITNLTTGKMTDGKAAADGSFDVRVDGSLDDAFVVRAVANGRAVASGVRRARWRGDPGQGRRLAHLRPALRARRAP